MEEFEYSREFEDMIIHLHRGKEDWPNYRTYIMDHLGGPDSRFIRFTKYLCPEIEYHCGSLEDKRVLDFGCGTGATTAALALLSENISAFDIDGESIEICKKRLSEQGLEDRVQLFCAGDLDEVEDSMGTFDIILANGVFEHIPLSISGLRKRIMLSLFDLLNKPGFLFLTDSPNRLLPVDLHSTQLWWIPWTKPGSEWAYKHAAEKGRHSDPPTISPGPLGLEEVGAWGITYWEIKNYLKDMKYRCLNLEKGHNRHIHYTFPGTWKRSMFEFIFFCFAVKLLRAPVTAFDISITNLVIEKC